jgi:hypothetical protein
MDRGRLLLATISHGKRKPAGSILQLNYSRGCVVLNPKKKKDGAELMARLGFGENDNIPFTLARFSFF